MHFIRTKEIVPIDIPLTSAILDFFEVCCLVFFLNASILLKKKKERKGEKEEERERN